MCISARTALILRALSVFLLVSLSASVNEASLVGHWKFDETSGSVAFDSSGNLRHATLINMDPSTDWVEMALDFDGINDRVATPVAVGTTFTWAAWFKMRSQFGYDSIMTIPNTGGASDPRYMLMDIRGTNGSFWANDGLWGHNLGVTGILPDVWYHITFVREKNNKPGGYKAYIDGVLTGSRNTGTWSSADTVDVGGRRGVPSQHFDGRIADVRIYDHALSKKEIADLYATSTRPGLVGRWRLDDGSGSNAVDSSGRGHDGSVVGNQTWTTTCDGSGALYFDGLSDYVTVKDHEDFNFDGAAFGFVAAARINPSDLDNDGGIVGRWESDNKSQWMLKISAAENRVQWVVKESDGTIVTAESDADVLVENKWTHVAGLAVANTLIVYIDGIQSGTAEPYGTAIIPKANVKLDIGVVGRSGTPEYFQGEIRDVHVYNVALSDIEIAKMSGAMSGHWKFDDGAGTIAVDSSGMNQDGTLVNGASWTTGKLDGAVEFDGLNDYVATDVPVGTAFTWAAWFKMSSQIWYDTIIGIPNSGGALDNRFMLMDMRGQNGSFWANDGLWGHNLGITGLVADQWYHLTFVRRGNGIADGYTAYLDGVRMGSRPTGVWSSSDALWIGGRRGVGSQHFHGTIDDVRIYQRALCDDEIADLPGGDPGAPGLQILKWVEIQ